MVSSKADLERDSVISSMCQTRFDGCFLGSFNLEQEDLRITQPTAYTKVKTSWYHQQPRITKGIPPPNTPSPKINHKHTYTSLNPPVKTYMSCYLPRVLCWLDRVGTVRSPGSMREVSMVVNELAGPHISRKSWLLL